MRAAIIEEFGPVDTHNFGELPDPTPGPGEVLIDVHAIGVNFPDTLMVQGLYHKTDLLSFGFVRLLFETAYLLQTHLPF